MNVFGGGGDGGAGEQRAAEARRENAIADSQGAIQQLFKKNFTEDFFGGRKQAYIDYAKPQLEDQFADARKQLIFALDRSGTLDSTARTQKEAELAKLYGQNSRTLSDAALGYENNARNNVSSAESDLLGGVAQSGNVGASINAANSRAAALSQPDIYSPVGQLFGAFTNALQAQAALEKAGVYGGGKNYAAYNTGLFANQDSVKNY
jgi:hypothetical protein